MEKAGVVRYPSSPNPEDDVGVGFESNPAFCVLAVLGEHHDFADRNALKKEGPVTTCDGGKVISPWAAVW